jgi:hypothetical protein
MEEVITDFLGNEIKVGDRGIRTGAYGHNKFFAKITVAAIDNGRKYGDVVGIIGDGNKKIGWTYPDRLITQESFKTEI